MKDLLDWLRGEFMEKGSEAKVPTFSKSDGKAAFVEAGKMAALYARKAEKREDVAKLERDALAEELEKMIRKNTKTIVEQRLRIAELELR